MSNQPELSVIVPFSSREESRVTAEWFEPFSCAIRSEFVFVQAGPGRVIFDPMLELGRNGSARHIVIAGNMANRELAINIGLHFCRAPQLFIFDPGYVAEPGLLASIARSLDEDTYVTVRRVFYGKSRLQDSAVSESGASNGLHLESMVRRTRLKVSWADGRPIHLESQRDHYLDGYKAGFNFMAVKKKHLLAVQGYNSDLKLSAWANADVQLRLERSIGLSHLEVGQVFLRTENSGMKGRGQEFMRIVHNNFKILCERYAHGSNLGTYGRDVAACDNIIEVAELAE
jgi:hypothetical protein